MESWEITNILQTNAFCAVVQEKSLPANRKMEKNPNDPSINVHEVEAILPVFQVWASKEQKQRIKVYTDSTNAYSRLREYTLKGPLNTLLSEIWLLAARWDIVIEPYWIQGKRNGRADTLSRFDQDKLTV